jgi:hypothetical protein
MRFSSLLLGPSALCLVTGTLSLGISLFFLVSSLKDDVTPARIGLYAASALLMVGVLGLLFTFALVPHSGRRQLGRVGNTI